jgi:hypothetical protein
MYYLSHLIPAIENPNVSAYIVPGRLIQRGESDGGFCGM